MSTDISVVFVTYYYDSMRFFDQRYVPNFFLFVPLGDPGPNVTETIFNHRISDGITKQSVVQRVDNNIFELNLNLLYSHRRAGPFNC